MFQAILRYLWMQPSVRTQLKRWRGIWNASAISAKGSRLQRPPTARF